MSSVTNNNSRDKIIAEGRLKNINHSLRKLEKDEKVKSYNSLLAEKKELQRIINESKEEQRLDNMKICEHIFVYQSSKMASGYEDNRFPNVCCLKCGVKNHLRDYIEISDLSEEEKEEQRILINTIKVGKVLPMTILDKDMNLAFALTQSVLEQTRSLNTKRVVEVLEYALDMCFNQKTNDIKVK